MTKPNLEPTAPLSEARAQDFEHRYRMAIDALMPEFWRLPVFEVPEGTAGVQVSMGMRPNGESTPLLRFLAADGTQIVAQAPTQLGESAEIQGEGGGGVVDSGFPCPPYCG